MAWPHKLYVATRTLGVYYTDNFSGPGTQPTWTAVNGGLPATDVRQFALDPFAPAVKQYVLLETARTLYRRDNGGSWAAILTSAQADTLCSGSNGYISHFWVDQTVDGRIWALYGGNGGDGVVIFALYSSDYGATWAAATRITTSGASERIPQGITAAGDIVFVQFLRGDGNRYARSVNKGATWYEAGLGYSSTTITANPLQTDRAYSSNSGGLILYTTGADPTNINASVGLTRADSMWFSAISAAHHRCIYNGKLYATTDSWSSNNSPSSISPAPLSIAPRAGADENQILVELTLDTNPDGGLQGHVIGCLYGEDDTTAVGIAGTNCETAPYTDAIPMTCGGAAVGGIAAVYEGVPIRLLSITRKTDLAEYASRVYPRGNSVSLAYTTRTASGEYTLDATAGYIANGTAEALYGRRDSVQYFDISLPDSTGSESEQRVYGANALYDAALEWLGQHDRVATFYSIVVTGYDTPPKPGETIHVLTTTTVDGADVIEIDDDFNIVEASYGIDADGLPIATLEITDIERRAVTGDQRVAQAIVSAIRAETNSGNSSVLPAAVSASGTASIIGGEINGTTIGLLDPEAGRFTTLQVDGTADIAVIASGTAAAEHYALLADGSAGSDWDAIDASYLTFTAGSASNWDGSVSPAGVQEALDQLAGRAVDLEALSHTAVTLGAGNNAALALSGQELTLTLPALADHDHSGGAGDGGTFDAANLTSGTATDGYVLTADGSGGAAWEQRFIGPGVVVYNNANIAIANNSATEWLTFNSELRDDDNMHSTTTNTDRLVATRAGWYYVYCQIVFAGNATGRRQVVVAASTGHMAQQGAGVVDANSLGLNVSLLTYLDVNDYVRARAFQTSGGSLNVSYISGLSPYFGMVMLS